jgi:hypothetical protein
MIIQEWRGTAARSSAEAYPKHFRDNIVPELRSIPGFAGAELSRPELDEEVEISGAHAMGVARRDPSVCRR